MKSTGGYFAVFQITQKRNYQEGKLSFFFLGKNKIFSTVAKEVKRKNGMKVGHH